jgi:hypothetical protein
MRTRSLLTILTIALGASSVAHAQAGSFHVGPRVTYNFDFEQAGIGFHAGFPIGTRLEFYPSVDVFFPDNGSLLGFNADFKFRPSIELRPLYLGAGLNLTRGSGGGDSNTESGLNLIGGLEARNTGAIHPFVEFRAIIADHTSTALVGGLNITLRNR